jgi:hypothetical protein
VPCANNGMGLLLARNGKEPQSASGHFVKACG